MCIPAYVKFYLSLFLSIFFGIYWVNNENIIFFIIAIILIIINGVIKCPKCNKPIVRSVDGWYGPLRWYKCDKCGQNLMECSIEKDISKKAEDKTE